MGERKRRKVVAKAGTQLEMGLQGVAVVSASVSPRPAPSVVLFDDPDPRQLWVGRERLADFLTQSGLGWVLAVREFLRRRDWAPFVAAYKPGGRSPYHPAGMLSLVLLGTMTGHSSLRELETLARADLRAWWLTGGAMPDHSIIGRFLSRHADEITEYFFEDLTSAVVRLLANQERVVAIDATVVQAASSRLRTIKQEAARAAAVEAAARAAAAPDDVKLVARAALAAEVARTAEARSAHRRAKGRARPDAPVCPLEPEAVVQPMKTGQVAPSYQACVAADGNRVIVGQQVERNSELAAVEHLLAQSERVMGAKPETVLGDGRYNVTELHDLAARDGFELLAPSRVDHSEQPHKYFDKSRFVFDRVSQTYTCPAGQTLRQLRRGKDWQGRSWTSYTSRACGHCPLRHKCVRGTSNREVKRYRAEEAKDDLRAKMAIPSVRQRYQRRQVMVEPVFAETKALQHHVRFRRRRMPGVRLEHALHCAAHNLRRALRLKLPRSGPRAPRRRPTQWSAYTPPMRWTPITGWSRTLPYLPWS